VFFSASVEMCAFFLKPARSPSSWTILAIANSRQLGYYERTSYEALFLSGIRGGVVAAVGGAGPVIP